MGVYVYSLKNSKRRKVVLDGVQVEVGYADYLCRMGQEDYYPQLKGVITRVENIPQEKQPEYVLFGYDNQFDGHDVYRNNYDGWWYDTPDFMSEEYYVGRMYKIGGQYHIVPKGVTLIEFMETNFNKLYNTPLVGTQVYVKMNCGYTATARLIPSLIDYMFGFGSQDIERNKLGITSRGDAPEWFIACVDECINKKYKELAKDLVY